MSMNEKNKKHLLNFVTNIIDNKQNDASTSFHSYLKNKMQSALQKLKKTPKN